MGDEFEKLFGISPSQQFLSDGFDSKALQDMVDAIGMSHAEVSRALAVDPGLLHGNSQSRGNFITPPNPEEEFKGSREIHAELSEIYREDVEILYLGLVPEVHRELPREQRHRVPERCTRCSQRNCGMIFSVLDQRTKKTYTMNYCPDIEACRNRRAAHDLKHSVRS